MLCLLSRLQADLAKRYASPSDPLGCRFGGVGGSDQTSDQDQRGLVYACHYFSHLSPLLDTT